MSRPVRSAVPPARRGRRCRRQGRRDSGRSGRWRRRAGGRVLLFDGVALGSKARGSEADLGGGVCGSWRWRQCCSQQRSEPWSGGTALSGSVALGGTLGSSGALGD